MPRKNLPIKLVEPGAPDTDGLFQKFPTRRKWLVGRSKTLGASVAPIIRGLLPWQSLLQLWSVQKGIIPPQAETRAMRMGQNQERGVIKEYELESGNKVFWTPNILIERRVEKPIEGGFVFFHASPDAIMVDESNGEKKCVLVEAKCSSHYEGWAGDAPPVYVQAQVQAALWCLRWEYADVVGYIGGRDLKIFRIKADKLAQDEIIGSMVAFVESLNGDEPPWEQIDSSDHTRSALTELWKQRREKEGKIITLAEFDDAPEKLAKITADKKDLEAQEKLIKNKIVAAIAEHKCDGILAGGHSFTLEERTRDAYTVKAAEFVQLNKKKIKGEKANGAKQQKKKQ